MSTQKRKTTQKGGSLIGYGKDGCVIDSFQELPEGYVSKIFPKKYNKAVMEKLKEIDPNEERFLQGIVPDSSFDREQLKTNADILACKKKGILIDDKSHVIFIRKLKPIDDMTRLQYRYLRDSVAILKANHIMHGDLPGNVMIDAITDHPIIIDWENASMNPSSAIKNMDSNAFTSHFKASTKKL